MSKPLSVKQQSPTKSNFKINNYAEITNLFLKYNRKNSSLCEEIIRKAPSSVKLIVNKSVIN
jgi:hypothetical protein